MSAATRGQNEGANCDCTRSSRREQQIGIAGGVRIELAQDSNENANENASSSENSSSGAKSTRALKSRRDNKIRLNRELVCRLGALLSGRESEQTRAHLIQIQIHRSQRRIRSGSRDQEAEFESRPESDSNRKARRSQQKEREIQDTRLESAFVRDSSSVAKRLNHHRESQPPARAIASSNGASTTTGRQPVECRDGATRRSDRRLKSIGLLRRPIGKRGVLPGDKRTRATGFLVGPKSQLKAAARSVPTDETDARRRQSDESDREAGATSASDANTQSDSSVRASESNNGQIALVVDAAPTRTGAPSPAPAQWSPSSIRQKAHHTKVPSPCRAHDDERDRGAWPRARTRGQRVNLGGSLVGEKRKSPPRRSAALVGLLALVWLAAAHAPSLLRAAARQTTSGSDELNAAILATMQDQQNNNANDNSTTSSGLLMTTQLLNNSLNQNELNTSLAPAPSREEGAMLERILSVGRIFIMSAIIVGDICGNSLVILSVCRHTKLRVTTNWFVVSLACADILVALFAMTFNASVIISGKWLFKPWVCDFWNSCDVLASTASILHLCCISIDRYIAITKPLDYPMKITTRRVMYALCCVWFSSALLSYLPIFTGIYTTTEHIQWLKDNPDKCEFHVNRAYAIVSSSISFWIPCCIMVFTYYRIYKEASRQEKFIYKAQSMMPAPMLQNHHSKSNPNPGSNKPNNQLQAAQKQRRSKSMALTLAPGATPNSTQAARLRQLSAAQQQQQFECSQSSAGALQPASGEQAGEREPLAAQDQQRTQANDSNSLQVNQANQEQPIGSEPKRNSSSLSNLPASASSNEQAQPANNSNNNSNDSKKQANNKRTVRSINNNKRKVCDKKSNSHRRREADLDEEFDDGEDDFALRDPNSGQSTPTKRSISKMKREHKAAKTLGIIMGVFILCWLPFFSWYTPMNICGKVCDHIVPQEVVTILFWIGYFNSTLNPIIYAYFNHEFRDAFKKTLQWIFSCCCQDLKCLRVSRANDNQHYNCTYRSTQEIVLVTNG